MRRRGPWQFVNSKVLRDFTLTLSVFSCGLLSPRKERRSHLHIRSTSGGGVVQRSDVAVPRPNCEVHVRQGFYTNLPSERETHVGTTDAVTNGLGTGSADADARSSANLGVGEVVEQIVGEIHLNAQQLLCELCVALSRRGGVCTQLAAAGFGVTDTYGIVCQGLEPAISELDTAAEVVVPRGNLFRLLRLGSRRRRGRTRLATLGDKRRANHHKVAVFSRTGLGDQIHPTLPSVLELKPFAVLGDFSVLRLEEAGDRLVDVYVDVAVTHAELVQLVAHELGAVAGQLLSVYATQLNLRQAGRDDVAGLGASPQDLSHILKNVWVLCCGVSFAEEKLLQLDDLPALCRSHHNVLDHVSLRLARDYLVRLRRRRNGGQEDGAERQEKQVEVVHEGAPRGRGV